MYKKLNDEIKNAMLTHNDVKRDCLRGLLSDIKNKTVNAGKPITDDVVIDCAVKAAKTRRESIEQFETAGRNDLVEREKLELDCLSIFVPAALSEDETKKLIDDAVANGACNIGAVMKLLPKNADKKFASNYMKNLFAKK
jgi:uncharacterized protein YqeY